MITAKDTISPLDVSAKKLLLGKGNINNINSKVKMDMVGNIVRNSTQGINYPKADNLYGRNVKNGGD